jgi:hypothetical protein
MIVLIDSLEEMFRIIDKLKGSIVIGDILYDFIDDRFISFFVLDVEGVVPTLINLLLHIYNK